MFDYNDDEERQQYRQLQIFREVCRHVPIFIKQLADISDPIYRQKLNGIVLFVDISGFTALTEIYSIGERKGVNTLTEELNGYLTTIIRCVMKEHGDVSKFAGDSLLCFWKIDIPDLCLEAALKALVCAFNIHKKCDSYQTKSGFVFNLRTVLAVGEMELLIVTDDHSSNYFIVGKGMDEMRTCEEGSKNRGVYISGKYWSILQNHLKIQPKIIVKNGIHVVQLDTKHMSHIKKIKKNIVKGRTRFDRKLSSISSISVLIGKFKKYILPGLMEKIEQGEPLQYLSELRQIACCFIKIDFFYSDDPGTKIREIIKLVEKEILYFDGVLMKTTEFDKGWSLLCVFGFPSIAVKNKAKSALLFAFRVRERIAKMTSIESCSAGVCTGLSYCGVIGHPERHEYTIIGKKVNMCARLMCNYTGIVSCDSETYLISKLDDTCFEELPERKLKGVENPGTIYSFTRESLEEIHKQEYVNYFDRKMDILTTCTQICLLRNYDTTVDHLQNQKQCIIYEGEDGSGRTCLLKLFLSKLSSTINQFVFYISNVQINRTDSFSGAKTILKTILRKNEINNSSKKKWLTEISNRVDIEERDTIQTILSEILGLQMSQSNETLYFEGNVANYGELMNKLIMATLQAFKFPCIILVDDIHFMDRDSIFLLPAFGSQPNSLVIGTTKPRISLIGTEQQLALNYIAALSHNVLMRYLKGMNQDTFIQLICSFTNARCVSKNFISAVHEKTRGLPGVLKEALAELTEKRIIGVGNMCESNETYIESSRNTKKTKNLLQKLFKKETQSLTAGANVLQQALYCSEAFDADDIPVSIELFYLNQYDSLTIHEQAILNNASVLGATFSRAYLFGISHSMVSKKEFSNAIEVLMGRELLSCARNDESKIKDINHVIRCSCPDNILKIAFMCKMLKFSHQSIKWSLYNKMTQESQHYRRLNSIHWLEKDNLYSCRICLGRQSIQITDEAFKAVEGGRLTIQNVVSQMRLKLVEDQILTSARNLDFKFPNRTFKTRTKKEILRVYWRKLSVEAINDAVISGQNKEALLPVIISVSASDVNNTKDKWIFERFLETASYRKIYSFESFSKIENDGQKDTEQHFAGSSMKCDYNSSGKLIYEINLNRDEILNDMTCCKFLNNEKYPSKMKNSALTDLRMCTCPEVISSVYQELFFHSERIEDKLRQMYYALKLAEVNIIEDKLIRASEFLDKVNHIRETMTIKNSILLAVYHIVYALFEWKTAKYADSIYHCEKSLQYLGFVSRYPYSFKRSIKEYAHTASEFCIRLCMRSLTIFHCAAKNLKIYYHENVIFTIFTLANEANIISGLTIHIMLDYYYTQLKRYDIISKICSKGVEMVVTVSKSSTLQLGNFYFASMLVSMMTGEIQKSIECGFNAKTVYDRLKATDEILMLIPYLVTGLLYVKHIELIPELLNYMEHIIESIDETECSVAWNWYYNLCLDMTSATGLQFCNADSEIDRIVRHNELLRNENEESTFYGFSIASTVFAKRLDFTSSRKYFRNAINMIAKMKLNNEDPLIQRCLLKLMESQLIYLRFNYSEYTWLIHYVECINKHSINYPYLLFLKAVAYGIKGEYIMYEKLVDEALRISDLMGLSFHKEYIIKNKSLAKISKLSRRRTFKKIRSYSLDLGLDYSIFPHIEYMPVVNTYMTKE